MAPIESCFGLLFWGDFVSASCGRRKFNCFGDVTIVGIALPLGLRPAQSDDFNICREPFNRHVVQVSVKLVLFCSSLSLAALASWDNPRY